MQHDDGPEEWHVAPQEESSWDERWDQPPEEPWAESAEEDLADEPWEGEPVAADGDGGGTRVRRAGRFVFGGGSPWVMTAVALAAVAIGVALGIAFLRWPSTGTPGAAAGASSAPSGGPATQPAGGGSGGSGGGLPTLSPLTGNGNGMQMQLIGRVRAVSSGSITVGGNGPSVTAAITSSTKFTGTARSAADIKVGDQVAVAVVSATTSSKLMVAEIQDPASAP
jgi:hypothetical protein